MNTLPVFHDVPVQRLPILDRIGATIAGPFLLAMAVALLAPQAVRAVAPDAPPPLRPFGIGTDAHTGRNMADYNKWMPQMIGAGLQMIRTPRTGWNSLEGVQGQWTFSDLDAQLDYLEQNHITPGGLLLGNPKWTGDTGIPTRALPAWSDYVTHLVQHVHGRIKYWEIWNEPPNGVGKGTKKDPAEYAKLVVAAYDAAKAADPNCLVGLAAKSVHLNYLEQVIKAGAKGHFDYIVLHPYESLGTVMRVPNSESVFMSITPTVHKMLAAQDPSKANAPIWCTELGFDAKKNPETPAHALVKAYTMGIAQGMGCISWFEGMDGDSGEMGLMNAQAQPRPAFTAYGQMTKYLGGNPVYLGWTLLNDKNYAFVFKGATGNVMVTWAPLGSTDTINFGETVSVVTPVTGEVTKTATTTLTEKPIIVDGPPAALVAQAEANRAKPFPWGGDYTDAKSVSVTMGDKNVEKGLHTQAAADVAADMVLYGGNARSGNLPGGNVFSVDPNFLSYSQVPIEITAMVRRDASNTAAQLELTYESTTGDKKAAAMPIPEGTDWQKITWRLDDPEFVSMYGFNFRLNKGSYVVQSVTVTKL